MPLDGAAVKCSRNDVFCFVYVGERIGHSAVAINITGISRFVHGVWAFLTLFLLQFCHHSLSKLAHILTFLCPLLRTIYLPLLVKGIVHLKIQIWWKYTLSQAILDVDEFVFSSEQDEKFSIKSLAQYGSPEVNGCHQNESPNSC